ncbi:hypothetical protein PLEOSDRAFT_160001 [Pleurotus ostreatus PC15]|uniref:Uncharacterized protein n=1 Tax=Pleurotus ostreatus (strain PC15) TaxID=1137138 RepID=A0A067NEI0_PLEO1|nr:hypothetical protein PLEOSDRAFT_160001 [Pleurotus ostreatus PC15]
MHVPPSIIALVILSMVYCNVCHVTGPWTTGRSLSRHQVQCRRKKQELTIARAAAEAAVQLNNPPTDILYNFIEVDPIQEEPQAPPPLPLPPPSPEPQLSAAGRRVRPRKLPRRYRQDDLPELPPAAVPEPITPTVPNEPAPSFRRSYYTQPNSHGLYKIYPSRPSQDPDSEIILEDLCDSPFHLRSTVQYGNHDVLQSAPISIQGTSDPPAPWFPFLSATVARLMCWFYGGSNQKSAAELDSLVHGVILQEDFDKEDLTGFTCRRETDRLDHGFDTAADSLPNTTQSSAEDSLFNQSKGWQTCTARIRLPADKVKHSEDEAPEFEVKGILLRPLLDVMRESFQGPSFKEFHLTPFEYCYCSDLNTMVTPEDAPFHEPFSPLPPGHQHVYGEVYTSSAMMEAHLGLPSDPNIESVVAAQMFWSDSTHLASFGNASLWPLYTLWGNQSKYTRARPTANACNHQAYIPSLPDNLADQYRNHFGVPPSAQMLTHLKRELMHAVWGLLLTPEYIDAYAHGIIIKCFDSIERRIFPRILTYSADYPEKILLATIKYLGGCPCPRCLVKKADIPNLGLQKDMKTRERSGRKDSPWLQRKIDTVRDWIFSKGQLVAGSAVDKVLKAESLVPTRNAFSRL